MVLPHPPRTNTTPLIPSVGAPLAAAPPDGIYEVPSTTPLIPSVGAPLAAPPTRRHYEVPAPPR